MSDTPEQAGNGLRWNAWNLLLLVPLVMLITPFINRDGPHLFGMPFFYWSQFAFVVVGVACVGIVYVKTKDGPVRTDESDELDEGNR